MKLRILGNSIRIRVSQTELSHISEQGRARDEINFAEGQTLVYELRVSDELGGLEADFSGNQIVVSIPQVMAADWTSTDRVSLRGEQELPDGQLKILVEKDFQCLDPRLDEDETNLFPHPDAKD
jgi:hypothetical protein